MNSKLSSRLDQILPRVTSESFLSSEGIGNEIACYIFDYAASDELQVRDHIERMMIRFESHHRDLRVLHLNLFDVAIANLEKRGLLAKLVKLQKTKDDAEVLRALNGPLSAERIRDFIADEYKPADYDLVLLVGVGSVWPALRAHNLLNCLHTIMATTPLVMFYPGTFDGTTLRLFGRIESANPDAATKPYYRAFTLIPGET